MKYNTLISLTLISLFFTACGEKPASSVSDEALQQAVIETANQPIVAENSETTQPETPAESVAETVAEPKPIDNKTIQTLTDSTGRISIAVTGAFTVRPDEENTSPTTLFAQNQDNNAVLTVSSLGKLQSKPDEYFKKLSELVKQQESDNPQQFSKTKVGIATNNRMNYRFVQNTANGETAEMCMAIIAGDDLYSVCANGENLSFDALNTYLQDVRIAG
ncbi:MAG: hypothetical protein IJ881_02575 [Neisseriaceae bacterium]|nr:hypothetical protein [Neisseriaceae bacterium]MBR3424544.1 hypothetical protein [Neisseriaceae bacterium]